MNADTDTSRTDLPLHEGLAFAGAITASVTHELNNILGTIDQIAGLLEDLAFTAGQGESLRPEMMNSYAERINTQTARGMALVRQLNAFAHSGDHPETEFDLGDAVENLTGLMRRLAGMQRVELAVTLPGDPVIVRCNPFFLRHLLFLALRGLLASARQKTVLEIALVAREERAVITLQAVREGTPGPIPQPGHLTWLASRLSGEYTEQLDGENIVFCFSIPVLKR